MSRVKASYELNQMSVLYVEDEDMIRDSFSYILQRCVKKLYTAVDGEDGLKKFHENRVDIIISDIKMPKLDGLEMSKKIKQEDESQHIVLTTAFGDIEYLKQAIEIGIDGYIIKPIDRNQLFRKLNKIAKNIYTYKKVQEFNELITIILNEQKESILLLNSDLSIKLYNNSFQKEMCNDVCDNKNAIELLKEYKEINTDSPLDREWFESIEKFKKAILYKEIDQENRLFFQITVKKVTNYIILSSTDITDLQMKNLEYEDKALKDHLTSLYNRRVIEKIQDRIKNKNICAIILDIDDFKKINDTFGHPVGDKVLKKLATTLSFHLRDDDLIIRWGGEEFLILLENMKNIEMAKNLAEKLRKTINKIVIDNHLQFTASFGISCDFIDDITSLNRLIKEADEALYRAKKSGKNRVEI